MAKANIDKETALTTERLKGLLDYDRYTGLFTWKVTASNRATAGSVAGSRNHVSKYISICIDKNLYRAHRLAWFYVTGEWPDGDVDHINGNRRDNRFENLRVVTRSVNLQNQRKARSNNQTSGVLGVSWANHRKKWRAHINPGDGYKHLGYFDTIEEAHQAYLNAKRRMHEGCTI